VSNTDINVINCAYFVDNSNLKTDTHLIVILYIHLMLSEMRFRCNFSLILLKGVFWFGDSQKNIFS